MRQVAALKKASIGLEAIQQYITSGTDRESADLSGAGADGSVSGEEGRIIQHNIQKIREATETAVSDIRDKVTEGSVDFPFQVGEGHYFDEMLRWAEENGAFTAQLNKTLQLKDLARIKRVAATMEYVTKLIEAANTAAGETAHMREATKSGGPLPENQQELMRKAVEALRNENGRSINYFFRNEILLPQREREGGRRALPERRRGAAGLLAGQRPK